MCEMARVCPIHRCGGYWMPAFAGMTAEISLDHLIGARMLGIDIPPNLLARADEVIE